MNFVSVLPDGTEYFGEGSTPDAQARMAVSESGQTCSRNDPVTVPVKVYELKIAKGQLTRRLLQTVSVQLPFAPMTEAEFYAEQADELSDLPPDFHGFISSYAWERGHAYGYEEVLGHVRDLTFGLRTPIITYTTRITK